MTQETAMRLIDQMGETIYSGDTRTIEAATLAEMTDAQIADLTRAVLIEQGEALCLWETWEADLMAAAPALSGD